MKRRDALKGLGLSLGYVVATPSIISLLQSCKNDAHTTTWTPVFFTEDQGNVIKNMVDIIIPKTEDSPGAIDVNVHKFIDAYVNEVSSLEEQEHHKKGFEAVVAALGKPIKNCKTSDYEAVLSKYLKADTASDENFTDNDKLVMATLIGLRSITIWGFKTSEEIGEKVLAYDPVPGVYNGCISLKEATGGKAWSL